MRCAGLDRRVVASAACFCIVLACTASAQTRKGTMGGMAVSANDVEFVSNAASTASLEVEAARAALEKARSPAIRNFAQRMVEDHTKLGMEVRALNVASSVGNVEI